MIEPIWRPSEARIKNSEITKFQKTIEQKYGVEFGDYSEFHQWSIDNLEAFWAEIWEFGNVIASRPYSSVLENSDQFPGARWFPGARLNFAENLLRHRDNKVALVSLLENGERREITRADLYQQVSCLAAALRGDGVGPGDCVAGFMPNIIETVVAMLAATSLGAIWSSCSPDFGINGVVDRFGQIEPKVLLACDGYYYNGKQIESIPRIREIRKRITSIQKLVVVPVRNRENPETVDLKGIEDGVLWTEYLVSNAAPLAFEQLPFDHPLYVVYSSGTTGKPKCIVHSAGGTLIQHLKEHRLHYDLGPDDVFFYYSTCGWVMWNILVSGLAARSTLVLFDGSPFYPDPSRLIKLAEDEKISVFGGSAKYFAALEKAGIKPKNTYSLPALKTILSTGSPLSVESFEYIYNEIKSDICLSSISGGTDIISAFVEGNPTLPVYRGQLQCKGLGMAVEVWDDSGKSILGRKGELVCTKPIPCCPVGFWDDKNDERFMEAYFNRFPGVWCQGDLAEITETGGMVIYGRSDAVLNPGGVRIGTAEIYRQVERVDEVLESVCVGQQWKDDVRVVLFVVLREGVALDEALEKRIRTEIRENATPRHVPAKIISVPDIPRTLSGKIVELAVRDMVHGNEVKNVEALANPEALDYFRNVPELQL